MASEIQLPKEPVRRGRVYPLLTLVVGVLSFLANADELVLKDGSTLNGEVESLEAGELVLKTSYAGDIKIKWVEIKSITIEKLLPIQLKKGRILNGRLTTDDAGKLTVVTQNGTEPIGINREDVTSINPPVKASVTYVGYVQIGISNADGNTREKSSNAAGEFTARSEKNRLLIKGDWRYAGDEDRLVARNASGFVKYDYFFTQRLYSFVSTLFEGDSVKNLDLRTAVSTGPGYQIFDKGNFETPWLKELRFFVEGGVSYFNESFRNSEDEEYVAARWAMKLDWPIVPKRVIIFHYHEGYPGLEQSDDIYISADQGVRFLLIENFFAAVQMTWRWDNTPAERHRRSDTVYLFNLGYNFDFAS